MRVYACVRERGLISVILHFKILAYGLRVALVFLHIRTCTENNTSFYEKQALLLSKTTRRFDENNVLFLGKEPNNGSKPREIQHTTCINISIKRIFQAKNPRRCAENKRRDVEKQRKSNEDIAKQKRHLPPICLKKVY